MATVYITATLSAPTGSGSPGHTLYAAEGATHGERRKSGGGYPWEPSRMRIGDYSNQGRRQLLGRRHHQDRSDKL